MSKTKYRFTYDEDWKNNETGELASRIAAVLAHRVVDNLMTIAENLTVETMVAITKYLLSMDAERLVFHRRDHQRQMREQQRILTAVSDQRNQGKNHIVSTAFEHHSVLHMLKKLERSGFEVTFLDIPQDGIVRPQQVAEAVRDDTSGASNIS